MPLLAGDRIRTQVGRVEILFDDGSTVHLDSNTIVDFQSDEVIRLLDGRVRLNVTGANRRVSYRVDAPLRGFRSRHQANTVFRCFAESAMSKSSWPFCAEQPSSSTKMGARRFAGERAFARGRGTVVCLRLQFRVMGCLRSLVGSATRYEARCVVRVSPETVQPHRDVRACADRSTASRLTGMWYPRVKCGWRPYYYGRWSTLRPWGWTWIGSDPWAWPTHHFGRWGFSAGVWFWIPGRHWGPAWVSWAYAPNYISWCPLGWNNWPVIGFSSHYYYGGRRWDPWHAWTVVPHHRFATGFVNVNVVHGSTFTPRVRNTFVVRDTAPDFRGHAVPRSTAPITAIGTRLYPRLAAIQLHLTCCLAHPWVPPGRRLAARTPPRRSDAAGRTRRR
jgi:hypothetical protein